MTVVNVFLTNVNKNNPSRIDMLSWVNTNLQSKLTKVEEMASGAAYCQLTDILFPGQIDLNRVNWNNQCERDWIRNWKLLQTCWKNIGVEKTIPILLLTKGKYQDNWNFLLWFKKFYDANYNECYYDALEARNYVPFPAFSDLAMSKDNKKTPTKENLFKEESPAKLVSNHTSATRDNTDNPSSASSSGSTSSQPSGSNLISSSTGPTFRTSDSKAGGSSKSSGVKLTRPSTSGGSTRKATGSKTNGSRSKPTNSTQQSSGGESTSRTSGSKTVGTMHGHLKTVDANQSSETSQRSLNASRNLNPSFRLATVSSDAKSKAKPKMKQAPRSN